MKFQMTAPLMVTLRGLVEEAAKQFGPLGTTTAARAGPAKALALQIDRYPDDPISSDLIHQTVKSMPPDGPAVRACRDHMAIVEPVPIGA